MINTELSTSAIFRKKESTNMVRKSTNVVNLNTYTARQFTPLTP